MKKLLSISIRILLICNIINHFIVYIRFFLDSFEKEKFIIPLIIYIILFSIIWLNSNKISEKIIGINNEYNVNINFKEILSIVIIALCIYFLFNIIGLIINNIFIIITGIINKIVENEGHFMYMVNIIELIINIIKTIILILILKYRKKILKILE